jgi:hypothetical protein
MKMGGRPPAFVRLERPGQVAPLVFDPACAARAFRG